MMKFMKKIWETREHECLSYVKTNVLSTAFCYASYTMGMEELTNFGMKNFNFTEFSK